MSIDKNGPVLGKADEEGNGSNGTKDGNISQEVIPINEYIIGIAGQVDWSGGIRPVIDKARLVVGEMVDDEQKQAGWVIDEFERTYEQTIDSAIRTIINHHILDRNELVKNIIFKLTNKDDLSGLTLDAEATDDTEEGIRNFLEENIRPEIIIDRFKNLNITPPETPIDRAEKNNFPVDLENIETPVGKQDEADTSSGDEMASLYQRLSDEADQSMKTAEKVVDKVEGVGIDFLKTIFAIGSYSNILQGGAETLDETKENITLRAIEKATRPEGNAHTFYSLLAQDDENSLETFEGDKEIKSKIEAKLQAIEESEGQGRKVLVDNFKKVLSRAVKLSTGGEEVNPQDMNISADVIQSILLKTERLNK